MFIITLFAKKPVRVQECYFFKRANDFVKVYLAVGSKIL